MIRLTLIDHAGKATTPQELSTAELREAADKARALALECQRLAQLKEGKKPGAGVPYLT